MTEPTLDLVLATCRRQPGLTSSDARLRAALESRGARVAITPWDAIDPASPPAPLVCLRSTWDYHLRPEDFRDWIDGFRDRPAALWNPPGTVAWNMDKLYLRELADAGVPLPLTRWFEPGKRPDLQAFFRATGDSQVVVKPRVSATAHGTHLVSASDHLTDANWAPLEASGSLIQTFVPEIRSRGEVSLVYFAGRLSHAVSKRAAPGDYRVQTDFGGSVVPIAASAALRAFGERVAVAIPHPWLYARIDLVETARGPVLMELELIEPDLFLDVAPPELDAAGLLAAALLARTSRP